VLGTRPAPRPLPGLEVDEAARLRAHQQARALAAEREQARQAALEADTKRALATAVARLRGEATSAWSALASAPDRPRVMAFLTTYGAATVTVGDTTAPVVVPEVREARAWLDGNAATEPPSPWMVSDIRFAPLFLWQPMVGWRQGLEERPDDIWLPYQWLAARSVEHPSPHADDVVADAAAYAEAWARTADAQRRRELAFALRGLVLTVRDELWAQQPPDPLPVWLQDRRALEAEHRGDALLTGAVAELLERAEASDACAKWARKLEGLPSLDTATFLEVFDAAAKLAPKVHRCTG
jgi:hypothetical protein